MEKKDKAWHGKARHDMELHGKARHDMSWHRMAWCGKEMKAK
jgi:hypothetical protein